MVVCDLTSRPLMPGP